MKGNNSLIYHVITNFDHCFAEKLTQEDFRVFTQSGRFFLVLNGDYVFIIFHSYILSLHVVKCLPNLHISKEPSLQRSLRLSLRLSPVMDKNA